MTLTPSLDVAHLFHLVWHLKVIHGGLWCWTVGGGKVNTIGRCTPILVAGGGPIGC